MKRYLPPIIAGSVALLFACTTAQLLGYFLLGWTAPSWLVLIEPLICPLLAIGIAGLVRVLGG